MQPLHHGMDLPQSARARFAELGVRPWLGVRAMGRRFLSSWTPRLACLVYHDVQPEQESAFRAQFEILHAHFEIVDLPEFGRRLRGEVSYRRDTLLLTFDDAFASAVGLGRILTEHGVSGVFFVPTDFIECRSQSEREDYFYNHLLYGQYPPGPLPAAQRPMTWDELGGLVAAGHCVGAHTRSHPPLHILNNPKRREWELIASADVLESRLGCRVEAFAVPHGRVEMLGLEALQMLTSRYRYVFTRVRGDNRSRAGGGLLRQTVRPEDRPAYVLLNAMGAGDWASRRERAILGNLLPQTYHGTTG